MDTGGGQIVCRTPRLDFSFANEHFAAASERLLEDGRGFTAANDGGRQKYYFSGAPPVARRARKTESGVPGPLQTECICTDIRDTYHTRRLVEMDLYTATRTQGLCPFYTYILLLLAEL